MKLLLLLSLLLFPSVGLAQEDCRNWSKTGIPFWYDNATARQTCRIANALEQIAERMKP